MGLILSPLTSPSLSETNTKLLLGKLSEHVITKETGTSFLNPAVSIILNVMESHLSDRDILLKAMTLAVHWYDRNCHWTEFYHDFVAQIVRVLRLYHDDNDLVYLGLKLFQVLSL